MKLDVFNLKHLYPTEIKETEIRNFIIVSKEGISDYVISINKAGVVLLSSRPKYFYFKKYLLI